GFNKRQRQKLKFQKARDEKLGKEVYGDDGVMTHYFGNAYEKKAKLKGVHTKGMGTARRKFVNMYGFDPTEYSFVRYLDPLTGNTIDESPITDIKLVQDHFSEVRILAIQNGDLDPLYLGTKPGIEAYYIKNLATAALKVDLTPHNPRLMCKNSNSIAKFPEREFELRQTGTPVSVDASRIPAENEFNDEVAHE
nr:VPg [Hyacinth mosaic virus]